MSEHPVVDVTIIGAGPAGLAAAYYAGHREASCRIIESLEQLGGQVAAVYPEKHIFDIAGFPKINGQEYVDRMAEQGLQYGAEALLGEAVETLERVRPRRRGAVGDHDRPRRALPHAHGDHHRRPRCVRAAHPPDRGPGGVARARPALLRQAQGRLRGQALRDRGRRRFGARLDDQPAGHRQRARSASCTGATASAASSRRRPRCGSSSTTAPRFCTRPARCARCTAATCSSASRSRTPRAASWSRSTATR